LQQQQALSSNYGIHCY